MPRVILSGWVEAGLFAIALAVLNVTYGVGQQHGVNPVALLAWAMPVAAMALLMVAGPGPDWRRIVRHPLSFVVGAGIIAMEAVYYVLIGFVTPTDGSVIVRLGVPIAVLLGWVVAGRRPSILGALGGIAIMATVLWYVPRMQSAAPMAGLALGAACGFIQSARSFASEMHPWNRSASTIIEKMRVTGLVLALASGLGLVLLAGAMAGAAHGVAAGPRWLPDLAQLTETPAIVLGLFLGALVLTAMQYLGFSVVVKLGAETFVATTALIPITTFAVQSMAVFAGILPPVPVDWRVLPAMAGVIAGVALVIAGGRRG
jgi:drug/metabolite transporter (DMT)-like permease